MKGIIGIGDTLVDLISSVENDNVIDSLGLLKGGMVPIDAQQLQYIFDRLNLHSVQPIAGGATANTIRGLGMLGVESGFVGSVGNDKFGLFFEEELSVDGVTPYMLQHNIPTGVCISLVTPDGERSMATFAGASELIGKTNLESSVMEQYSMLYTEGYLLHYGDKLTENICSIAKTNKMEIAFDLSSYNIVAKNREQIAHIVEQYVDILFANEQEAAEYTEGLSAEDAARRMASECKIVVVKMGERGSIICSGEKCLYIAARKANPIDTTGAGDLYASGFLYGYLRGADLSVCGQIATLVSNKVIEGVGANIDREGWREIKQELTEKRLLPIK